MEPAWARESKSTGRFLSSTGHKAPGREADLVQFEIFGRQFLEFVGDNAAGGAAGLDRFEPLLTGNPAPDFFHDGAQGDAHGHFHQAGVFHLAHQGEDLGAGAVGHPDAGIPLGPMVNDVGDVGPGLDVVDHRGAVPQALFHRVGRPGDGLADPALDGGQEGRLLAADKGAGAAVDLDIEVEPRSQDVPAQESQGAGLLDGDVESPHRKRIFGPDIEIALFGAHGPGADGHALQHGMGVAFHDGPVHEGARVAFVAVGDDKDRPRVFPGIFHRLAPLITRWGSRRRPGPAGRRCVTVSMILSVVFWVRAFTRER